MIEYGFTGSFDNAAIAVSKEGGGGFVALSPAGVRGAGPRGAKDNLSEADLLQLCDMGFDEAHVMAMGLEQGCSGGAGGPDLGSHQEAESAPDCRCDCEDFQAGKHEQCAPGCGTVCAHCGAERLSPAELTALRTRLESENMPEMMINQYLCMLDTCRSKNSRSFSK